MLSALAAWLHLTFTTILQDEAVWYYTHFTKYKKENTKIKNFVHEQILKSKVGIGVHAFHAQELSIIPISYHVMRKLLLRKVEFWTKVPEQAEKQWLWVSKWATSEGRGLSTSDLIHTQEAMTRPYWASWASSVSRQSRLPRLPRKYVQALGRHSWANSAQLGLHYTR